MIESGRKLEAIILMQKQMLPRVMHDRAATDRLHTLA
jgi:hypothetical protein